jgi:hypothetical protein
MKDQKDVKGLIIALKDDDATVRYRAAQALDELRDLRAVWPLTNALRDEAVTGYAMAARLNRSFERSTTPVQTFATRRRALSERSAFGRGSNRSFGSWATTPITSFARRPPEPSERWETAGRSSRLSMRWPTRTTT